MGRRIKSVVDNMKHKALKTFTLLIATVSLLTGCDFSFLESEEDDASKNSIMRDMGVINYEESTLGIPLNTENITEGLTSGQYYILHEDTLYPCYTEIQTYDDINDNKPDKELRYDIFTSDSVINIPTLFEGDSLLYYNETGILDYYTLERFKDLGWSIGIRNLKTTEGGYVYTNIEEEEDYPFILDSLSDMRDIIDTSLLIDKIGGVKLTNDYVEDGIITGLIEGVPYDLEVYNGTNYYYFSSTVDTRYFQSFEVYKEGAYTPLQDYLYEIDIPDYLLTGYYNIDKCGLFRYVKGKEYDDLTDFNQKLLYQYTEHDEGDYSASENNIPSSYSSIPTLNNFRAYDVDCFGYEDNQTTLEELAGIFEEERKTEGLDNFLAASKTQTDLWLPDGEKCKITINSDESTGSIYLKMANGRMVSIPYDRINKFYNISVDGENEKATLIVQGLYHDYKITLTDCEGYREQDVEINKAEDE